jgi:hypothetical protein
VLQHRYCYSAIGYTLLITCLGLQWGIINFSFWEGAVSGERSAPTVSLRMLFEVSQAWAIPNEPSV